MKKVSFANLLFLSIVLSFLLAPFFLKVAGSLIGDSDLVRLSLVFALIFGFVFSAPFSFAFLGTFYFGREYKKILLFTVIPAVIAASIWGFDGDIFGFLIPLSIGLGVGVVGMLVGFLTKFLYKKLR